MQCFVEGQLRVLKGRLPARAERTVTATVWFRTLPEDGENADPAGDPAAPIVRAPGPSKASLFSPVTEPMSFMFEGVLECNTLGSVAGLLSQVILSATCAMYRPWKLCA